MAFLKSRVFLGRPLGGIELETVLGIIAVLWAAPLLVSSDSVWAVRAFQSYYDIYPHWVFSVPWALAGLTTLTGIDAYRRSCSMSRPLRIIGSFLGMLAWGWVFIKSTIAAGGDSSFLGIYLIFSLASFRLLVSNCRPWRPPPWATG